MVDSFKRGYAFMIQAWRMARADPDLLLPSLYTILVGLVVTMIGFIPLAMAVYFLSERTYGQVVTGFFAVLLLFALICVGVVFSAMTTYLIYGYLAEGDGRMDHAWTVMRRGWLDMLGLAGGSLLARLFKGTGRGRQGNSQSGAGVDALGVVWDETAALAQPAMVIEDLNLKDALGRVAQIARAHLLPVRLSFVGVRLVNAAISVVLGGAGIAAGLGLGLPLIRASHRAASGVIGGLAAGVLLGSAFILAAIAITAYTTTAYHTCLYLWARDVELARREDPAGQWASQNAPAPLAAALDQPDGAPAATISQS